MSEHVKIYGVIPKKQYVADGTTTTFEFPFAIFSADDIEVYLGDTKQSTTSYTVSGVRDSSGGAVTFVTAPETNTLITIMRHLSIERLSDFQEGGALRADTLNDELDYQIACQQQIAENLNRSMVLPPYAVADNVNLTLPTPSAGKAIVWNSEGTNLENSTIAVNEMESVLNGYKTAAQSAATTATEKAGIASDKADIATDKAQVATEKAAEAATTLTTKANKDLDNLSESGKKKIANLPMPSNQYVDLTLGSSGATYTAPANGWIYFAKDTTSGKYISLYNSSYIGTQVHASYSGVLRAYLPVKKDDEITVSYNAGTTVYFRFIYAEGEL